MENQPKEIQLRVHQLPPKPEMGYAVEREVKSKLPIFEAVCQMVSVVYQTNIAVSPLCSLVHRLFLVRGNEPGTRLVT